MIVVIKISLLRECTISLMQINIPASYILGYCRVPQLRTWARLIIRQFSEEIKEERSLGVFLKKYIVDSDWGYPLQLLGNLLAFLQEIIHVRTLSLIPSFLHKLFAVIFMHC